MVAPLCHNNNWHLFQAVPACTWTRWLKGNLFICFPANSLIQIVSYWIIITINHMSSCNMLFPWQLDAISNILVCYSLEYLCKKIQSVLESSFFWIIRWLEVMGVAMGNLDRSDDHNLEVLPRLLSNSCRTACFKVAADGPASISGRNKDPWRGRNLQQDLADVRRCSCWWKNRMDLELDLNLIG